MASISLLTDKKNPDAVKLNKGSLLIENQSSKGWYILAIAVGILVIGAGGFGAVGLLQSHGMISLPQSMQWLSSAIGTIGSTPHFWSLWTMAGGGFVLGAALVTFGSYKIHSGKQAREQKEAASKQFISQNVGNFFSDINIKADDFAPLGDLEYFDAKLSKSFGNGSKTADIDELARFFIVIKTDEGKILCTKKLEETAAREFILTLDSLGYERTTAMISDTKFQRNT